MTDDIDSFGDVVDLWPSVNDFARDLSVKPAQAYAWRARGRSKGYIIPPCHWNTIVEAARLRKIKVVNLRLFADLAEAAPGR